MDSQDTVVSSPCTFLSPDDVLMGRGARATENEGNVRFRHIVRDRLNEYVAALRRQEKDQIAREILGAVKSRKGRFMRKLDGADGCPKKKSLYVVVDDEVALLKVKQALRDQKLESLEDQPKGSRKAKSLSEIALIPPAEHVVRKEVVAETTQRQKAYAGALHVELPSQPVLSVGPSSAVSDSLLLHKILRSNQIHSAITGHATADPSPGILSPPNRALLTASQLDLLPAASGLTLPSLGIQPSLASQVSAYENSLLLGNQVSELEALVKLGHLQQSRSSPLVLQSSPYLDPAVRATLGSGLQVLVPRERLIDPEPRSLLLRQEPQVIRSMLHQEQIAPLSVLKRRMIDTSPLVADEYLNLERLVKRQRGV